MSQLCSLDPDNPDPSYRFRKLEEYEECPNCKEKHLVINVDYEIAIINYVKCTKNDKHYEVGFNGKTHKSYDMS